jgi:D-amino-acid oxidase
LAPQSQRGALPVNLPETACSLPRVRVSAEREIRTVVGLRPFRPSGFRVAREMVGETIVVHNYGHGGGGITLSGGLRSWRLTLACRAMLDRLRC